MLNFTDSDKNEINNAYRNILLNLKSYLQQYNVKNELEYYKIIINMLHSGFFSMNRTIKFDNNYDYLELPSAISQGVHVMYGICCCRHATEFLYDLLRLLKFNPSMIYVWVDDINGIWRRVNPAMEKANHEAIISNNNDGEYIVDPANRFILQIESDGQLNQLDIGPFDNQSFYQESNIEVVGKVLKKYYTYKKLGIKSVY